MVWREQKPEGTVPVSASTSGRNPMDTLINIGKSVQIKGELTGSEDLTIDGVLEGKIHMKEHHLTVGTNGSINAEICAKSVAVLGKLVGNIKAGEKVEVAASGSMEGDITAPRVILADGASFKGSIDMEGRGPKKAQASSTSAASTGKDVRVTA